MAAVSNPLNKSTGHIRKIDLLRDLEHIANLIEICFPIHLDRDGQTYVKQMRKAARDLRIMGWLSNLADLGGMKNSGFVWEQGGRIVGNLSLIPFTEKGQKIYLIANVAVHPDFRRQGIARRLTFHALQFLQSQGISSIWLQVKEDNPAAVDLYRSVGFVSQDVRTTWRFRPKDYLGTNRVHRVPVRIKRRSKRDWPQHQRWLENAYPPKIRWNLPVDFKRFSADSLQGIFNTLDGIKLRHWSVYSSGNCVGVVTWQKTNSYAHNLWFALDESVEAEVLAQTLDLISRHLPRRHPLSLDYPKGRCQDLFEAARFTHFRTLIWMKYNPK